MTTTWDILKLASDPTRLRLLALLRREELSVAELQEILQMGQSRISSHLSLLRQGDLVVDRKDGKRTFYSFNTDLPQPLRQLVETVCGSLSDFAPAKEDGANLARILEKRRRTAESYFNTIAGRLGKNYCPGRSWEALVHFFLQLTPELEIADLGAGEGILSQLLARRAKKIYCIDNSPRMVEVGAQLAKKHGFSNLSYKLGDIEKVPLPDACVDLAILSQALHHAEHPQTAVDEAVRILRPGGRLLVLDLKAHEFEKARELYADRWLGFSENTLLQFLKKAGLRHTDVNVVAREEKEPHFETLLACGVKGK